MAEGLATHCAAWEPARAGVPGRVLRDGELLLATDYEGGNGVALRRVGTDQYALDVEPEPGTHSFSGRGYYYCVGCRSVCGTARRISVRVRGRAPGSERFASGARQAVLRQGGEWRQLAPGQIRELSADEVEIALDLPGDGEPLFVSNVHWWPYGEVVAWMRGWAARRAVRVQEIGRSAGGRPIYVVELGRDDADALTMVHAQTPQPAEMLGSLACRAMIEWLLSGGLEPQSLLERCRIAFLPATNPDGSVLGYGVSDGQGRFPYFEADLAAREPERATPENLAVWRYLQGRRPLLFLEWHANNWARRPGHMLLRYRHEMLGDVRGRAAWDALEDELLALPGTHHGNWTSPTEGLYQASMGYQAVTRLGGLACMVKQHDKFPLDKCGRHAIACLRACARALDRLAPVG